MFRSPLIWALFGLFCVLRTLLKIKVQNGYYILGCAKISSILGVCLICLINVLVNGTCWDRAHVA